MLFNRILKYLGLCVLCSFLLLINSKAEAAKDFVALKKTRVFSKRTSRSPIIVRLNPGERVPISKKKYGSWRKVLVWVRGKRRTGFIHVKQLRRGRITNRRGPIQKSSIYHHKMAVGVPIVLSFTRQGERAISLSESSSLNISSFSGFSLFLGAMLEYPLSKTWVLRGSLLSRKISMAGTVISSSEQQPAELSQSFLGFEFLAKYYTNPMGDFWIAGGGELAKGTSVKLKVNSSDTDIEDKPFFTMVKAGVGYDTHLFGKFYLLPETRIGLVINTSPMIMNWEVLSSVAYRF